MPKASQIPSETVRDLTPNLCLRLHLLLAVDPKWIDELNSDVKQNLLTQMSAAENVAKKCKNQAAPWAWLKKCHINAWDPPILREIFSNKPTTSTGKLFV